MRTQDRLTELGQTKPPAFFLYVDQGEELYARADEEQRRLFSELLAEGVTDRRLRALGSLRADFLGALQRDEALYSVHHQVNVPPLREIELRTVVSRPAELLTVSFESKNLAADIALRTAEESTKDAGALPLLSYLLDDMWTQMVARDDGVLRLPPQAVELGGILAERADKFLADHPDAGDTLRRILTLKLANVREEGDPTRRRGLRSEFSAEEWQLISELADYPHRMVVTATPDGGETYAEVAHEAIFRRWAKLQAWIAAERDFLVWKAGLESELRNWRKTPQAQKNDALLMGLALAQAQQWIVSRPGDLPQADLDFIVESVKRETAEKEHKERLQRRVQWIGLAALVLVTAFAGFSLYQWREANWQWNNAETAKLSAVASTDIATRTQAKYDVLKAAIEGENLQLATEDERKIAPERRRNASTIMADLSANYQLLDGGTVDSFLKSGAEAKKLVWLDDLQSRNQSEATAFMKLGFSVLVTRSIEDTVARVRQERSDLVITHYGFSPNKEKSAAYRLRNALVGLYAGPIIIYSVGVTPEYACIAQQDGFYDETDMPAKLIEVAIHAVRGDPITSRCPRAGP